MNVSKRAALVIAILGLMGLTFGMFWDVILLPGDQALSNPETDLATQFAHWRSFGYQELRKGNLPLWNPHIFSGMPFFAGFQSALLYPLNGVYLFLPLPKAINVGIVLHVFLGGVFALLWASRRSLHPLACFLVGAEFMFCGPHFLHIYAGHLSNLCALIWVPLLFLVIEELFEAPSLRWCLLGMFAVAMQILAGHPQYVFYTGVAALLYTATRMAWTDRRLHTAMCVAAVYGGAVALTAVQLLPGLEAAQESVRGTGVSYAFASMFSLPPENLVTWLVPGFFGDMGHVPYWGRWYLWEMSLFVSLTGFGLALYALAFGTGRQRWILAAMVLVLLVLALGANTPLFRVLYERLPGFGRFRGSSKFALQATVFLIFLSGMGFDLILRAGPRRRETLAVFCLALAVAGVILAHAIRGSGASGPDGLWFGILQAIGQTRESYLPQPFYADPKAAAETASFAATSMMVSAGLCVSIAAILIVSRLNRSLVLLLLTLAVVELFAFARLSRTTFPLSQIRPKAFRELSTSVDKNDRLLNLYNPNSAMSLGILDIWGHDPGVLKRYAAFIAFTQGQDPDEAGQYIRFNRFHRLYAMLRCRHAVFPARDGLHIEQILPDAMPRLVMIRDWRIVKDRDRVFSLMDTTAFDPRETVILEEDPMIPKRRPSGDQSEVRLVDSSTDHLTVEAKLTGPAVLLITDAYSKGWRARPLDGSTQDTYRVMPGNYALQAVPLIEGYHLFRLEYEPNSFRVGRWISVLTWIGFGGAVLWCRRPSRHHLAGNDR